MNEETKGRDIEIEGAGDAVEPHAGSESRVETAEFCARFRRAFSKFLRDNFLVSEGTLLYGLSAVSILLGLAMLIGPILGASFDPWKTIPCIGALNGYELALLGVLLLILAWGNAVSDGVTLVVLIGVFLGASGIANTAVANDSPGASAILGVACLVLAGMKLTVLIVRVGVPLRGWLLAALGLLLACNFLAAPIMADQLSGGRLTAAFLIHSWYVEAAAVSFGAALLWIAALRTPSGTLLAQPHERPFLRSQAMSWILVIVVMAGVAAHLPALSYVYGLQPRSMLRAYLPLFILGDLLMLEFMRCLSIRRYSIETIVALAPVLLLMSESARPMRDTGIPQSLPWLWNPSFLCLLMAGATAWRCSMHYWPRFLHAPAVYLCLAAPPISAAHYGRPDEAVMILLLWAILAAISIVQKKPVYLVIAALLFTLIGLGYGPGQAQIPLYHGPVFAQVAGTMLLLVCSFFLLDKTDWARLIGVSLVLLAAILMMGSFRPETDDSLYTRLMVLTFCLNATLTAVLFLVPKDYLSGFFLAGGMALTMSWRALLLLRGIGAGWMLVLLSFVLLGIGAYLSLTSAQTRRVQTQPPPLRPVAKS